jgi:hypothetical protein
MKSYFARLFGVHRHQKESGSDEDAASTVERMKESAALESAEKVLEIQANVLKRRYRTLSDLDVKLLIRRTLIKLRSKDGLRKLSVAGSPAGYIAVILENAVADFTSERKRAVLAGSIGIVSAEEHKLLAMSLIRNMSIGEIAVELRRPYADVAAQLFRLLCRIRQDREFRPQTAGKVLEHKDIF